MEDEELIPKKQKDNNNILLIILTIVLSIPLIYMGVQISRLADNWEESLGRTANRGNEENIIDMLHEMDSIHDKYYIGDKATNEEIEDGILKGVEWAYDDPYGLYRTPEETAEFMANQNEMLLGGIGIQSNYENNMEKFEDYKYCYYITHVYSGSPAEKAGIQEGDRLIQVNELKLNAHNADDFLSEVRGKKGTNVNLKILREENGVRVIKEFTLTREDVKNNSIFYEIIEGVGYITINTFSNDTDEEFEQAIEKLKLNDINKFILDIRNNSGGSADTVVQMLDYMLPKGLIVDIRYKDDSKSEKFYSDEKEATGEFVVLVNESSASASELFAKSLQEYNKATIIGEVTYGKGTVVSTIMLSNGGSVTLSTGEYYTKSGENLEGVGVIPDIEVSIPDNKEMYLYKLPIEEDLQLIKAIEVLGAR